MSKHTKGPWRIGTAGPNGCATIGTHRGLMVAMVAHSLNQADQRDEAIGNAQLIAAAPELLEALVLLEREMVESGNAGSKDYGWKPAIEKTRDAIAKATGAA